MMRILLINPYYPISETPAPPLGLAYLGAALEAAGARVRILDYVVYPYRRAGLQAVIQRFKPHMIGATAVTMTFDHARQALKDAKTIDPQVMTIMGGPHVTFRARETLAEFPELDIVVRAEGEKTLVELMQTVSKTHKLADVDGIAYRKDSEIRITAERKFIENLDTLPLPARHLLPLGRYRALGLPMTLTTSRGCPYKCIFCVGRKMGGAKVRYHSADRVVTELAELAKHQFHQINIADDLFTAHQAHCQAVCEAILRQRLKINWTAFARVDTVSERLLSKMKVAGCTAISFGMESANPAILQKIKKGITLNQIRQAVRMCRQVGIRPYASFILGLPGETRDTIEETRAFAARLQQEGLAYGFHILAPFPGTEAREQAQQLGIRILTNDWSKYHANRAVVETAAVKQAQLDEVVCDWENKYNQYLGHIQKDIQAGTAPVDAVLQLESLERTVLLYELMMKNIIEENGRWPHKGPKINTLKILSALVDRIIQATGADRSTLEAALAPVMANGSLNFRYEDGRIQWQWQDFL